MTLKLNIYDQVTNAIIAELEKGIIPWNRPWINSTYAGAISHTTGKPYSFLNQMLLGCKGGEWLTYGQIKAEGGHVKRGEKASLVVFWSFVQRTELEAVCDEHGNEIGTRQVVVDTYPVLKGYNVFHIDQCEGIKPRFKNEPVQYDNTPIERAEDVITAYVAREGLKLNIEDCDRACYSPLLDRVQVPQMAQYKCCEEYYSTLFHELTHSTGHERRLKREGITELHFFGDQTYSKEELVAEMGSAFILGQLGIESASTFRNSVAYIQGWLKALKNDHRLIVQAAAKAEQAARFIITGEK